MEYFNLKSRYYFTRLSDFEKKIYEQIYNCWATGGSVAAIELPQDLPQDTDLKQIVLFIIEDNPHLFHLETNRFQYRRSGTTLTIEAEGIYHEEEYQTLYAQLIHKVKDIATQANQYQTDYEKLRFLHDYLAENIKFDPGDSDPRSQTEAHTIVGALLKNACACDGYARAFRLLCDYLNLSCIVVSGNSTQFGRSVPHTWNYVKINNQVYHVDLTWDSDCIANGYPVTDYYFLRGDAVFSRDHAWNQKLYHPCPKDYPRTDPVITSKWELEQYLCDQVKAGNTTILVQLDYQSPGLEALQRIVGEIIQRNPTVFSKIQHHYVTYQEAINYAEVHFE